MKDIYKTNFFKVISINQFQLIILCLFPISIVIGPLVSEIIILLFNIFLYEVTKKKNFIILKTKYLFFY